ncbi:MAG: DeoR/GlpR family DNA-binding transcription regulator [Armatimonadota bacterium]|nr:DeoR/GlpR family DNA-binding transcription regulator [Armatimonadota bacterium]MDR7523668.1 DeoR/GlpR family DNA-binding transcription regulator [Armatimonadota bacterium]
MAFPQERRRRILQLLEEGGSARTVELQQALGVSIATVRRDLEELAQQTLIERTHGGALWRALGTAYEPSFALKSKRMREQKERIAEAAARLVSAGVTVLLDSGTTTLALARQLAGKPITLIALDLPTAQAAAAGQTEVLLIGGRVRNGFFSLVGPWAEETLRGLNADLFFLAADAVDDETVTNSTVEEAAVKRLGIRAAREAVLVADHSKFGRRALAQVCRIEELSAVITDGGIGAHEAVLRERVKRVVIA